MSAISTPADYLIPVKSFNPSAFHQELVLQNPKAEAIESKAYYSIQWNGREIYPICVFDSADEKTHVIYLSKKNCLGTELKEGKHNTADNTHSFQNRIDDLCRWL